MSGSAIDVTNITRVFGCTRDDYINRDDTYDAYTLYLVRDNTNHNATSGVYTEAYYGDRRVTDVLVIDKHEYNNLIDIATNETYPDDKIYLVPYYSEDVRRLSGQLHTAPAGYNICFKHNGIVSPICQALVAAVQYDYDTDNVSIVFNCEDGEQRVVVYQGAAFTYVVEVTEDEDNPGTYLADKSPQEIRDAYDAGRVIVCIYDDQALYLIKSEYDENDITKCYATFGVVPSISFPDEYVLNIKIFQDSHAELVQKNISYLIPFDINVLTEDTDNNTVTLDQMYSNILTAVQSHKRVTMKYLDGTLLHFQEINEDDEISFVGIYDDGFIYIKVKSNENTIHKKTDNQPEGYPLLGLSGKLDTSVLPGDSQTFSLQAKIHLIDILRNVLYKAPVDLDNLLRELLGNDVDFGKCGENVNWYYIDSTLYILGNGAMYNYPSYLDDPADAPAPWKQYSHDIVETVIGEGVTTISNYAFYDHSNMRKITIPTTMEHIYGAFYGCTSLSEVHISDLSAWCKMNISADTIRPNDRDGHDYYIIGQPMYYSHRLYVNGNILTELTIPSDVTSLSSYSFRYCEDLTSVVLPETLTSVGTRSFDNCKFIENIYVYMKYNNGPSTIGIYAFTKAFRSNLKVHILSFEDYYSIIARSLGSNYTDGTELILDEGGDETWLVINSSRRVIEVTLLDDYYNDRILNNNTHYKFYNISTITKVTIPSTVTDGFNYGNGLFECCSNLNTVIFESGSTVTVVPLNAFNNCTSLININLPDTIEIINGGAFNNCTSLLMSRLPTNLRELRSGQYSAFGNCSSITISQLSENITRIDSPTFIGCTNVNFSIYSRNMTYSDSQGRVFLYSLNGTASTANVVPPQITNFSRNPFARNNITEVYITIPLDNTPEYVTHYLIESSTTITDFYVPWAEGAVLMKDTILGVTSIDPWTLPSGITTHYDTICVNSTSELSGKVPITTNCAVVTIINGKNIRYDRYEYESGSWVFKRTINSGTML